MRRTAKAEGWYHFKGAVYGYQSIPLSGDPRRYFDYKSTGKPPKGTILSNRARVHVLIGCPNIGNPTFVICSGDG
ncbi:hypothetical protein BHYA_0048g00460 [Botrytis hyacinthi]|uniref:Uncharacterized protein n=1 Tax=Botrytis hyacinthi TaxID=278943 RepID=A0A4Z1GXB9_9HELO|nr:hypothetical protein BHYA_0048g00460 [Botrytis hyacinthi]